MELMIKNAGWHTASNMPSSVLTVIRAGKLKQAAWQQRVVLHSRMLKLRNFATGTRWMVQLMGYSTIRIAI
jgi:hypothetical protein